MEPPRTPSRELPLRVLASDINDTPCLQKVVHSAPQGLATNASRNVMLDDLQETVPQVAWEYFEDCLLPPLPRDVDIMAVVDALKKTPAVISRQNKLLWAAFANGTPKSQTDRSEDKVFSAIEKIVVASNKALKKVSSHSKKLTVRFKCRPTTVPSSESRSNRSKPDGYFLLNEGRAVDEVPPKWQNIVVPAEYKKGDDVSDLNANASQILWSLTHAMREDARRRFVFGFTIENTRMRLWFASRQVVLASYPENDFTTAIGRVAGFFLRILYAERHALGFDETIVRLPPGEGQSDVPYEIEVGGKWYRTQRLISAIGAESIRGRGTRVWEVKELDGPEGAEIGPCMVLKDGWPDYDRDREEVIHEKILDAAEKSGQVETLKKHMLTVHAACDVLVEGRVDDTLAVMCRGEAPPYGETLEVKKDLEAKKTVHEDHPLQGAMPRPSDEIKRHFAYHRKVHHRIIFEEVGTTIMESETISFAFDILQEVVEALRALHSCGWVHRDISAGNILIVNDIAKLADLEYAKAETDNRTHDLRTGTAFFMAVEVEAGTYLYGRAGREILRTVLEEGTVGAKEAGPSEKMAADKRRKRCDQDNDAEDKRRSDSLSTPALAPRPAARVVRKRPFRQNPLHDLESVLWLGLYVLFCSVFKRFADSDMADEQWTDCMKHRKEVAAKLFNSHAFRHQVISTSNVFSEQLPGLHPQLQKICLVLEAFCELLVSRYAEVERKPGPIPFASAVTEEVYEDMSRLFGIIADNDEYCRIKGKHIRFSRNPDDYSQQREEMQSVLNDMSQAPPPTASGLDAAADEDSGPPAKVRRIGLGSADVWDGNLPFHQNHRNALSDSVRITYKC